MKYKTVLMWCRNEQDLINADGKPVGIFDSIENAREWLKDIKNLRRATMTLSTESDPEVTWEVLNNGALQRGRYSNSFGVHGLLIGGIHDNTTPPASPAG